MQVMTPPIYILGENPMEYFLQRVTSSLHHHPKEDLKLDFPRGECWKWLTNEYRETSLLSSHQNRTPSSCDGVSIPRLILPSYRSMGRERRSPGPERFASRIPHLRSIFDFGPPRPPNDRRNFLSNRISRIRSILQPRFAMICRPKREYL